MDGDRVSAFGFSDAPHCFDPGFITLSRSNGEVIACSYRHPDAKIVPGESYFLDLYIRDTHLADLESSAEENGQFEAGYTETRSSHFGSLARGGYGFFPLLPVEQRKKNPVIISEPDFYHIPASAYAGLARELLENALGPADSNFVKVARREITFCHSPADEIAEIDGRALSVSSVPERSTVDYSGSTRLKASFGRSGAFVTEALEVGVRRPEAPKACPARSLAAHAQGSSSSYLEGVFL